MTSKRAVAQLLQHLSAAGVTHVPRVDLQKRVIAAVAEVSVAAPGVRSALPHQLEQRRHPRGLYRRDPPPRPLAAWLLRGRSDGLPV
ncbi:MAG UNVERIFIED_CONTAM: hypothetical protein LVR18_23170 [Planctomycetaceae bacterium]|jgi:hypothetical protein